MPGTHPRRLLAPATVALIAVTLTGCGDSRTPVPNPNVPQPATGVQRVALDGVLFSVPKNWTLTRQSGALGAVATSGSAVIALWRFSRPGAAPAGAAEMATARSALLAAVRHRDPAVRILGTSVGHVDGDDAIAVDAIERIDGHVRRVQSVHLLRAGSELVLDEYAPVGVFARVDRQVFSPVLRALRPSST